MNQFDKENQLVIKNFVDRKYIHPVQKEGRAYRPPIIELYITSDCDLKCTYCYLQKQQDKLYPKEFRDMSTILGNLEKFLDWYDENGIYAQLNIFSGEFLALGENTFKILDMLYDHASFRENSKIEMISIPSNMSFIQDEKRTAKIEAYFDKFIKIGVKVHISASIDGKILEQDNRPFKLTQDNRDDVYYERVFKFLKKYNGGCHPMVSSHGIEKWIENYNWFTEMTKKHLNNQSIMMLEVRDDDWTDEAIMHYLHFLDHVIEKDFREKHNSDLNHFAKRIIEDHQTSYDNIALNYRDGGGSDRIGCMIQGALYVRLGDLSLVPCHRLSYSGFEYGKFEIKDDKIVDLLPGNIGLMTTIYALKSSSFPGCEKCEIKELCSKGCLGSQYEIHKDPFLPNKSVCKLYKAKFAFLFKKYEAMGVFKAMNDHLKQTSVTRAFNQMRKDYGLCED